MAKKLKKWQGWTLFGGSMIVVFVLGLLVSSLMERRAEVASVFNNKRTQFTDSIIAQNERFKADYPREYETWAMTEDTSFESKYNSSDEKDVLEALSRATTIPLAVISIVWMIFVRSFVRVTLASMAMTTCSLPPVGLVKDRMLYA